MKTINKLLIVFMLAFMFFIIGCNEKNNSEIYNIFSYAEIDKNKLVDSRRLLITGNELYRLFDF